MRIDNARAAIGCLLIDELMPGRDALSGLSLYLEGAGMTVRRFICVEGDGLNDRLQSAYYAVRQLTDTPVIVARGSGCWAALALSEQLPAERLVLIEGQNGAAREGSSALRRQIGRLRGYARRNLAFCVSDILMVGARGEHAQLFRRRFPALHGRVRRLCVTAGSESIGSKMHENSLENTIVYFLQTGELPKSLAENPEMCIIYG